MEYLNQNIRFFSLHRTLTYCLTASAIVPNTMPLGEQNQDLLESLFRYLRATIIPTIFHIALNWINQTTNQIPTCQRLL